jgi:hypothetical protein
MPVLEQTSIENGFHEPYVIIQNNIHNVKHDTTVFAEKSGGKVKISGKKPTSEERQLAESYLTYLLKHYDHESATELYLTSKWGWIRPKAFMSYGKGKVKKLYEKKTEAGERSWLYILDKMQYHGLIDLCFVTVSAKMLNLSSENEDYKRFYDTDNIEVWQMALEECFPGPLR